MNDVPDETLDDAPEIDPFEEAAFTPSTFMIEGPPEAQLKFFTAMAAAQAQMKDPVKNAVGRIGKGGAETFKYADLQSVLEAVRPPLAGQGIAIIQAFHGQRGGGYLTTILAGHGAIMRSENQVPRFGPEDAKDLGSYLTYLKRYALQSITGVAGDTDIDETGERGGPRRQPAPPRQPTQQQRPAQAQQRPASQPPAAASQASRDAFVAQKAREDQARIKSQEEARERQRKAQEEEARRRAQEEAAQAPEDETPPEETPDEDPPLEETQPEEAPTADPVMLGPLTDATRKAVQDFALGVTKNKTKAVEIINRFARDVTGADVMLLRQTNGKTEVTWKCTEGDALEILDRMRVAAESAQV